MDESLMKTNQPIAKFILLLTAVWLLVGCGGSGSATSNQITPKVVISWPTITREVNAPPYAGSAEITLTVGSSTTPSHWFIDRPSGDAGQSIAYSSPDKGKAGPALLQVRFHSKAGAAGTEIASAAVSVQIDSNGTLLNSLGGPLGTVTYSSEITGFFISRLSIAVDDAQPIIVSGFANNTVVALPQSIVNITIVSNPENASVANGVLTGKKEGPFQLHVSFDSVQGNVPMKVTPKIATYNRVAFPAKKMAWDPIHNKFWGTFGLGSVYANSIVDVDPITGVIGNPISVGSKPNEIAISADGSTAYVGLDASSAVRKVNLNTRTAGATTSLTFFNEAVTVTSLDVNPSNPDEFSACVQNIGSTGFGGPLVFRGGVQVGTSPDFYTAYKAKYLAPDSMIGVQEGISSGSVYNIGVTGTSVDFLNKLDTNASLFGDISVTNGTAVLGNGFVFDPSGISILGQLLVESENALSATTDSTNNAAWVALQDANSPNSAPYHLRKFDLSNFVPTASLDLQLLDQSEYLIQINRFGASGLAILSNQAFYVIPSAPGF